jgi:hypothetical protein
MRLNSRRGLAVHSVAFRGLPWLILPLPLTVLPIDPPFTGGVSVASVVEFAVAVVVSSITAPTRARITVVPDARRR